MIPANDLMPTEWDIREARAREARIPTNVLPADKRHRIAWFWKPQKGRYELRVLNNHGQWTVISR
jgi:hypothetical protein